MRFCSAPLVAVATCIKAGLSNPFFYFVALAIFREINWNWFS